MVIEGAASLLLGPWLNRGLYSAAAEYDGPGRAAAGTVGVSFDVDFLDDVKALDRLIEELHRRALRASFAVVGHWVREYPGAHKALVAAGHEIVNHTLTHPDNEEIDPKRHFHRLNAEKLRNQIVAGHQIIEDVLGVRARGFRAPHFGHQHTEAVYPILTELGYDYSSSTLASRAPSFGWPHPVGGGLWEMPVTVCPRHPFSSFDTWHFIRKEPNRHRRGELIAALKKLLEAGRERETPLFFYFDPRDVAADGECREALDLLAGSGLKAAPFAEVLEECRKGNR